MSSTAGRLIDSLIDENFITPTRLPRSPEYLNGVRAILSNIIAGTRLLCPFDQATAAADAWQAGTEEGSHIWRKYVNFKYAPFKETP